MDKNSESEKIKRRRPNAWQLVFTVTLIGLAFYLIRRDNAAEPGDEALLMSVEIGSIENTIAAAGSLKPSDYVDVGAQVSGQLQRLYVEIGDVVSEGQLLAEIDARIQEARVQASRANIESLEAQVASREASLNLAIANAERQSRLMAQDATSQLDYDNALNLLASAESSLVQLQKQIEQSRASLESDEAQLEYTRIYAPMAGTVVAIEMEEGRTLNANQTAPIILRIADLGTMTVEAEVSEADIGDISAGLPVYFTTLGGRDRRWYGSVRQVLPTPIIDNNVVLYTALFDVENSDGALLPEMTAQVFFVTSSARDVVTVPLGAVTFAERPARGPDRGIGEGNRAAPGGDGQGRPPAAIQRQAPDEAGTLSREAMAQVMREARSRDVLPRPAWVTIVEPDGSERQQQILVGVSSRVAAEVLAGLQVGDQVVAGLIQRPTLNRGAQQGGGPGRFMPRGGL